MLCVQVKREAHTQHRHFNRQYNRIKSLASNNKTETYNEKSSITDNALLVT